MARYGQCGVSRHPQFHGENDFGLTIYRATDGEVRHAVRADRLAPRPTTGTLNACRCDESRRVDSAYWLSVSAVGRKQCPRWHEVRSGVKSRTRPSIRSYCRRKLQSNIEMLHQILLSLTVTRSMACSRNGMLTAFKQSRFLAPGATHTAARGRKFLDMPIAVVHLHICEPVLPSSKAEHRRRSDIPEALPSPQCYSYTTTSPRTCQQLGTWRGELWVSQSGLPILNPFKNSSHMDQTLGRTLLSRMNITARPALSPQCYPITPNLNGSTFECRQQRLAPVMMRVI